MCRRWITAAISLSLSLTFISWACPSPGYAESKLTHEQQWIINSIGLDIAEMSVFAGSRKGLQNISPDKCSLQTQETAGDSSKYSVELSCGDGLPKQTCNVTLKDYVWAPDNYAPWAVQLIEQLHQSRESSGKTAGDSLIEKLSDLTSKNLAAENTRVSNSLTEHPLDPVLQEEAALLCASFALRESASCMSDIRPWLNRVSAHLALAKALRGRESMSHAGQLAQAATAAMCGREIDSMSQIDALKADKPGPALQSWLRALAVRASGDYRIADNKNGSLVERFEYGRALSDEIGADYLTDYLRDTKPTEGTIDWMRIGARGISSVEAGHIYCETAPSFELNDFGADSKLFSDTPAKSPDDLLTSLELRPNNCFTTSPNARLLVISWPDVAAFHNRHLMDSIFQRYHFEKVQWGVPEEAKSFADSSREKLSVSRFFPLVEVSFASVDNTKSDQVLASRLNHLLQSTPEDINMTLWQRIVQCASAPNEVAQPQSWFSPTIPFGTTFDFRSRNLADAPKFTEAELEQMRQLHPSYGPIVWALIRAKYPHESFTGEQLEAAYGKNTEYDLGTMRSLAFAYEKNNPAKYAEQLEKMAQFKPDEYFQLGAMYAQQSKTEKAKQAYENGIRLCRDSVHMSNSCSWLVNYYFDHGEKDKALELAQRAADVYSARGLETLAKLYERMNKLDQAEEYFKKMQERYDDPGDLAVFYKAHRTANPRFKSGYESIVKSIFPQGLQKVDATKLTYAPDVGISITSSNAKLHEHGLRVGDIFVAVQGYRVANVSQYRFACEMDGTPDLEFIVWNGKHYQTVKANLPEHRWGCSINAYKKQ
jgi:tetratricopeptide (TPR) repeat protein